MQQQNTQKVEASKVPEYIKKAARKAAEFNSHLNRERMEERRAYFDLQTHVGPARPATRPLCGRLSASRGAFVPAGRPAPWGSGCHLQAPVVPGAPVVGGCLWRSVDSLLKETRSQLATRVSVGGRQRPCPPGRLEGAVVLYLDEDVAG